MADAALIDQLPLFATAYLLLFARVGAVLMLLPVFSEDGVPGQVRLLIALGFSFGLWPILSPALLPVAGGGDGALAMAVVAELLVGLALGTIVRLMFMAITVAGSLISLQVGLTSAVIFDPAQSGQAPLLSRFIGIAAALVCMALAVHHLWIEALVRSYGVFPVGALPPAEDFAMLAVRTVGDSFALGVSLAAPLVVYGIVFNLALGLAARIAPAIQVFFIAQPLNLLAGLGVIAAVFGTVLIVFAEAMRDWMAAGWG